ncbi:hypothetical protein Q3O60_02865 [Alkalimonas collagenimarina]|uniref:Uncharacterized protein n=1 Tax=Alkalimonas collagenimarina TaxID=400390 RepID=A0ABT9GVP8_9GAMM|nr:hypothetical protein [Alkalimonas collagenimarina]MDP4535127.1 hypothetical protein [Alkalimonas collagenimarina]
MIILRFGGKRELPDDSSRQLQPYLTGPLQQQQHVDDVEEQRPALIARPNELTPRVRSLDT